MTTYAIAQLRRPATALHPDVFTYMEEVQATLDPFAGRFLVHGVEPGHDSAAMGRALRELQLAATGPAEE